MRLTPFDEWTVRGVWWPTLRRRSRPALALVVHHSVTLTDGRTALQRWRDIEEVIYGRRWSSRFTMTAYSYLEARGEVAIARGTKYRNGANNNTRGDHGEYPDLNNGNTISVCVAGNYQPDVAGVPTMPATRQSAVAVAGLYRHLIDAGALVDDAPIIPHRALHRTSCPGNNLVGKWLDMVRTITKGKEVPEMTIYRLTGIGFAVLDWQEHGATISAISATTSDNLEEQGALRLELSKAQIEGYRWRWADHLILDESTASAEWVQVAKAAGLANAGHRFIRSEPAGVPAPPAPVDLEALADAVADELGDRIGR